MAGTNVTLPQAGDEVTATWGQDVAKGLNGIQSGQANVTVSAAVSGTALVTFPKPYASPPVVVASYQGSSIAYIGYATSVTATQMTLLLTHKTAGTTFTDTRAVSWVAFGVLA